MVLRIIDLFTLKPACYSRLDESIMTSGRKLYIHIGTNKTGTSTIQHFLSSHRKELADQGLLYPKAGCTGGVHYEISRIVGFDHGKQPAPEADRTALLKRFKAEVEKSRCETCVISSENFVLPKNVELVRDLFSEFDCRIVVYLRRHDHWWFSAYNQAVKMVVHPPWGRGFQGFLNFNRKKNPKFGNYRALLDRWEKVFGRENIIVRPYEQEQNQPNIIADFLRAIDCAELCSLSSNGEVPQVNRSLDHRSTFLIETFQRMEVDDDVRRLLIDYVMANAKAKSTQAFISPEIRRQIVDKESRQYEYIAREYLNRPDGILYFEPLPDPRETWTKPEYPTIVEVANIVAQVLTASNGHGESNLNKGMKS